MWCVVKALHHITLPCVPELMCIKWLQVWQKDSQLLSLILGLPKTNAVGWSVALACYIRNSQLILLPSWRGADLYEH